MLIEDFLYDNYDFVYDLKMIAAQREEVLEGSYSLFDSENPHAYNDQLESLNAINKLVVNKVLCNMQKCRNYLNDNYSRLIKNDEI